MTDDASERIWVQPDVKGYCITGVWPWKPSEQRNVREFIRADHAQAEKEAAVAEAYEDAASLCSVLEHFPQLRNIGSTIHEDLANDIRARGNVDALAARDAQVRAEALREAAVICKRFYGGSIGDVHKAILANQEGDG